MSHLYTVSQTAARFGRHPKTILRWLDAGRLTAVKTGAGEERRMMITGDSIEQLESAGDGDLNPGRVLHADAIVRTFVDSLGRPHDVEVQARCHDLVMWSLERSSEAAMAVVEGRASEAPALNQRANALLSEARVLWAESCAAPNGSTRLSS